MGYSNVGTLIYISEKQELFDDPGFWFRFLDQVDGIKEDLFEPGLDNIKDHGMNDYLIAIQKWQCDF